MSLATKVVVTPKTVTVDDLYGMIPQKKKATLKQMKQGITEYLKQKVKYARN